MASVKTVIDGKEIKVERDRWALEVARELGIHIPTLCYHPALEPYGACRLCVVEVTRGKWTWLTTSCDLPIREGLSIRTDSPSVIEARKMALELIWAHAPDAVEVQDLAKALGVDKPRFPAREEGKCILCGLCVRVCREVLEQPAICFSRRGADRTIGTPFDEPSKTCIGCQACASVCPTGHVLTIDREKIRQMASWNTELELVECEACGKTFAPIKQLQRVREKLPEHVPVMETCPSCRRLRTAESLSAISERLLNRDRPVESGGKKR
jgi:NADH dehydrogenase/NADH:ubiquinone oxidoreductase subunit G